MSSALLSSSCQGAPGLERGKGRAEYSARSFCHGWERVCFQVPARLCWQTDACNIFASGFNRNHLSYVGGAPQGGNRSAWRCCGLGGMDAPGEGRYGLVGHELRLLSRAVWLGGVVQEATPAALDRLDCPGDLNRGSRTLACGNGRNRPYVIDVRIP